MKKLAINLSILLVILAVTDRALGGILDIIRDNAPDGRYFKARYSLNECDEDIIILGSSRGESNYAPYLIEDSLGMTCWNASRGGQGLSYFRCMEEGILNRYTPKWLILNIEADILDYAPLNEHAGFLRPFYNKHPEIRPILNEISWSEPLLMNSRLYAYNSSFYYLMRPYLIEGLDGKSIDKGWKPLLGKLNEATVAPFSIINTQLPLNEAAVRSFETFIKRIEQTDCQLFMVVSPNYGEQVKTTSTMQYLKAFSEKHNIPMFDYSADNFLTRHPEYFNDVQHLNKEGAIYFTRQLISKLKQE
ncbi:MAG: hypothetical protein DHS20C18_09260 [Saprospiraceae bacterium]|nr:MAG: hypothetical protein DHS20C18_09260 [Saprospiraceae bacterium]